MNSADNHTINGDDALVMVHRRNAFYRSKYHFVFGVYCLSWLVIVLLAGLLIFVARHPPNPLYFATDDVGRLMQEVPLDQANMSKEDVVAWVIEAVQSAYSFDFVNYRSQMQSAQKYFTDYGWRNYMQALKVSNNLLALSKYKYVVVARVVDQPKLLVEGTMGAAYAWRFEVPVLVTYLKPPYDDKSKFSNPLSVIVTVRRLKLLESYKGLGITQTYSNIVLNMGESVTPVMAQ